MQMEIPDDAADSADDPHAGRVRIFEIVQNRDNAPVSGATIIAVVPAPAGD